MRVCECILDVFSVMCVVSPCYETVPSICRCYFFFFQAEDGIRDLVRSRGLGDVYKRQVIAIARPSTTMLIMSVRVRIAAVRHWYMTDHIHRLHLSRIGPVSYTHLTLPTSDLV